MKKYLLKLCLVLVVSACGFGTGWAQRITLFHETFGDNTGNARAWNDAYSVKSGVAAVYSGITRYTVSNVKQGKNTTGSTKSGLNQSAQGTDAYIIIGPLNVANYTNLLLKYQWKAASINGTYTTKAYYATSSTGSYTEITGGTGAGATTFVERSYSVPAVAQVSTLYLKIVWNTSNTQAIIDEVDLSGIKASGVEAPSMTESTNPIGPKTISLSATAGSIYYTIDGTTPTTSSTLYSAPFVLTETATVKAIAVDKGESSTVSSFAVTIKAAANLPVSTGDKGKSGLGTGFAATNLGSDYSNAPKLKFDDTGDELVFGWNGEAKWFSFDIKGNSYSGATASFKVLTSADGISYTEIANYTSLGSTVTKAYALNSTDRFIKWVYANKSSGNVALGNINVYDTYPTITLAEACTDGEKYYGTFSSACAFVVPEDLTVSVVAVNETGELSVAEYETGNIVAANTGVMVSGTAGNHTIVLTNETATEVPSDNNLHPSSEAMTGNNLFYRLTMHNGTQIGFYWGAEDGAAFEIAAGKAYLAVPASAEINNKLWFAETETGEGIATDLEMLAPQTDAPIYDLMGRRVAAPAPGHIYIRDGVKYLAK